MKYITENGLQKLIEHYQDANFGEIVFFYFQAGEIVLAAKHESEKWNMDYSKVKVMKSAIMHIQYMFFSLKTYI